jgi:hypothetical protein
MAQPSSRSHALGPCGRLIVESLAEYGQHKGFKVFETNQNKAERVLRFFLAAFLIPAPFAAGESAYTYLAAGIGGIMLFNAFSGVCMTYKVFGVNTCSTQKSD